MQVTTVDMDVSAVARSVYSIAGTWKSSDGSRLVFDNTSLVGDITAQGQATVHNYVHLKDDYQEGSGGMMLPSQEIEGHLVLLEILALSLKKQLFLVQATNKIPFK